MYDRGRGARVSKKRVETSTVMTWFDQMELRLTRFRLSRDLRTRVFERRPHFTGSCLPGSRKCVSCL